jgi:predicted HAD superfamily hydrolase
MFNSFDVFDTLIGRLSFSGKNIFLIIEKKYNIVNFGKIRQDCETKGIDNIYLKIKKHYENLNMYMETIDWEIIKNYELELEYDLSFPINKYIDMVKQDDILVSDMYLEEHDIMKILNKHKVFTNKLYVEPAHKSNCLFWKSYPNVKNILTHYGDNKHSDFLNPKKFGINSYHITNVDFLESEIKISSICEPLSWIIRAVRLTNQNENFMNKIFCEIVLPLGILICLYLNIICKNDSIEHIIFISRDGYWFKYIYNTLYPEMKTTYFYLSRKMVETNSYGNTINNIEKIKEKKLIFDLFGTGKTLSEFVSKSNLQNYVCFMCFNHHKSKMLTIKNLAYKYMQYIDYVESLYPAPHPSVVGYDSNNYPIFKNIEYDVGLLKDYMIGIETFQKYYNKLNAHMEILSQSSQDLELIRKNIFYMLNIGNHSFIKNIHLYINDNKEPEKNYDYTFTNPSIKYYIENICKFKSNGICLNLTLDYQDNNTTKDINYLVEYLNWKTFNNIDFNSNLIIDIDLVILDNVVNLEQIDMILNKLEKKKVIIIINNNSCEIEIKFKNNNYSLINNNIFIYNYE